MENGSEGGLEDRWIVRSRMAADSMADWSLDEWVTWWSDGMEIWFSEAPEADREMAFAPIRINADREELAPRIVSVLERLSANNPRTMAIGAAKARARQTIMESAILEVVGRRRDLSSEERALLLVRVAAGLQARNMPDIVRAVMAALNSRWLGVESSGRLISRIGQIVYEAFTSADIEGMRSSIEALLRKERNFRPILAYCLKAYRSDFPRCIEKFYTLWINGQGMSTPGVWEAVADRLNDTFSPEYVAQQLLSIRREAESARAAPIGFVPAEKLAPLYSLPKQGLAAIIEEEADVAVYEHALEVRGIEIEEPAYL